MPCYGRLPSLKCPLLISGDLLHLKASLSSIIYVHDEIMKYNLRVIIFV